jgi:hypothetical protein
MNQLRKVALLYITAIAKRSGYDAITELDVINALKGTVFVKPNTFNIEIPQRGVVNPWGPSIIFQYTAKPPKQDWTGGTSGTEIGDPVIMKTVEDKITARYGKYITNIVSKYLGNGTYQVNIIQVKQ